LPGRLQSPHLHLPLLDQKPQNRCHQDIWWKEGVGRRRIEILAKTHKAEREAPGCLTDDLIRRSAEARFLNEEEERTIREITKEAQKELREERQTLALSDPSPQDATPLALSH
jgi:hypothetical protein